MRVLVVAAAALALSACWIWEDEPQYVFRVLTVAEGASPVEFTLSERRNGLRLIGPFIARCPDALITADVDDAETQLNVTVNARNCGSLEETTPYDYELIWTGLDEGSYTLVVRHQGQAPSVPDGVVFEESIVIR